MSENKMLNTIMLIILIVSGVLPSPISELVRSCVILFLIYRAAMNHEGKKRILVVIAILALFILIK